MAITDKELQHIAKLAKLDIKKEDFNKFKSQFDSVLEFVSKLKEVDVSDIHEGDVGHINNEKNNWREDAVEACSDETKKAIIKEAPETKDGYIKVPGVLEAK